MKLSVQSIAGESPFLNLAVIVLIALVYLGVGCGPSSSGSGRGGQGALGLVPDSVVFVQVVDMDEVLKDEEFLESKLPDSMIVRGFGDLEEKWDKDWGITAQDINAYVQTSDDVTIFEGLDGRIDFELIEDTLYDSGYDEDDYRGYALWEVRGQSVAILEDDGYVIIGDSDDVKRYLRLLDQEEGSLLQDDENPLKRVLDRVGTGLLVKGSPNCAVQIEVRRCQAGAVSVSTNSESYTLEHTVVFLFGSERTAERHVEDFEDHLEKVQDSASSLEYQVTQDGEFIEVKASIDWDDLGNCELLDTLLGNECLIAANVPTTEPAPRSTPGLAVREPIIMEKAVVKEVEVPKDPKDVVYEPVMQMRSNLGNVMNVKGRVVDYMSLPAQQIPFALEIQDTQNPSVTIWLLVQGNRILASGYLGETVCVTGTVQQAIGLLIEFGILEGYAIEVSSKSQLMRC